MRRKSAAPDLGNVWAALRGVEEVDVPALAYLPRGRFLGTCSGFDRRAAALVCISAGVSPALFMLTQGAAAVTCRPCQVPGFLLLRAFFWTRFQLNSGHHRRTPVRFLILMMKNFEGIYLSMQVMTGESMLSQQESPSYRWLRVPGDTAVPPPKGA